MKDHDRSSGCYLCHILCARPRTRSELFERREIRFLMNSRWCDCKENNLEMDFLPQSTLRCTHCCYSILRLAERWPGQGGLVKIKALPPSIRLSRLAFACRGVRPLDHRPSERRICCLGLELTPGHCLVDDFWFLLDESHKLDRLSRNASKAECCSFAFPIRIAEDSSRKRGSHVSDSHLFLQAL